MSRPKGPRGFVRSEKVTVETVAYGGAGVGRVNGKVYFVPFTVPGEVVIVEPTKDQKRFCEGRLVSIEVTSPDRVDAPCPAFGSCGGCAYQHVSYERQLLWKRDQVGELLRRIGKIENPPLKDTVPSPQQWNYRNRIRVHVRDGRVGFFQKHSSELVDISKCLLASSEVNDSLAKLRRSQPDSGEYTLSARPDVRFFEQTNDGAAAELLRVVDESIGQGEAVLIDAYCGGGFFARRLADRFESVIGIEAHEEAVERARRKASANERYICGDVTDVLGGVLESVNLQKTVVLLDPPAAGLAPRVVEFLTAFPVKELVYISCDPATQARDIGGLVRGGYRLKSVTPVDMFPQTSDVEVVACLEFFS